jgi:hypothetical protein
MRGLRVLALLIPLAFGTGCFVFDELDAGMEIMEAHTPQNKKKAKAEAAAAAEGEAPPTYDKVVQDWWKDAGSLNAAPRAEGEAGSDAMIPCVHGGKTLFTRKADCLARGGRPG